MILESVTGGGAGLSASVLQANCLSSDDEGFAVYITGDMIGDRHQVSKIDIDSESPITGYGFGVIRSKESATECVVQTGGILSGVFSGLVPGRRLFVSTTGTLDDVVPPKPSGGTVRHWQKAGYALTTSSILINFETPFGVRA
jgi:hypothetical protein